MGVTWSSGCDAVKNPSRAPETPEARSIRKYSQLTTGDRLWETLHAHSHFKAFESARV